MSKNPMTATYAYPISFASELLEMGVASKSESNSIEYGLDCMLPKLQDEMIDVWEKYYMSQEEKSIEVIYEYTKISSKSFVLIYDFLQEVFAMNLWLKDEQFFQFFVDFLIEWQTALFNEWKELKTQE